MFSIFWLFLSDLLVEHFVLRKLQRQLICCGCVLKSFESFKIYVDMSLFAVQCKAAGPLKRYMDLSSWLDPAGLHLPLLMFTEYCQKGRAFLPSSHFPSQYFHCSSLFMQQWKICSCPCRHQDLPHRFILDPTGFLKQKEHAIFCT